MFRFTPYRQWGVQEVADSILKLYLRSLKKNLNRVKDLRKEMGNHNFIDRSEAKL